MDMAWVYEKAEDSKLKKRRRFQWLQVLLPEWLLQIAPDMLTYLMYTDQLHALR